MKEVDEQSNLASVKGSKQQVYVNIAKGFAICAVVLLHIHFYNESRLCHFVRCILGNSWHVAVFFLISGFFVKTESLIDPKIFLKRKLKARM